MPSDADRVRLPLEINGPAMIVGGGEVPDCAYSMARGRCDFLVAADGGADAVLARGQVPDAVVGDLDSLSDAARGAIPPRRIVEIAEQDTTDFDKALRSTKAPLVLAVGVIGRRIDHELAALHTLVRHADRAVILLGQHDLTFATPRRLEIDLPLGMRVSLFPMNEVRAQATGLRWPEGTFDLTFHPARKIGTSNEVSDGPVRIQTDAPGLLTILPSDALDPAIAALANADFHSPPR